MATGDQPLKFSDFFDVNDRTAIDKINKGFKLVSDQYDKTIKTIEQDNQKLKQSLKDIKDEAKKLQTQLKKNDTTSEKRRKTIQKVANDSEKLLKTQKKRTEQLKKNNKQIDILEGNLKQLNTEQRKLNKLSNEEIATKLKLQQATKRQRDGIRDLLVLENKQSGTLEKLAAINRRLRREREKLNLGTQKGRLRLVQINKELDKNNVKIKQNSDQLKKQRLSVGGYTEAIKGAAASSGLFGGVLFKLTAIQEFLTIATNKDNIAKEISRKSTIKQIIAEKSLTRAKKASLIAQKLLNTALKASIIGAIVTVLGALFVAFTRTQKRVDQFSDAVSALGAIVDIFLDRLALVGEGVIKLFQASIGIFTDFSAKVQIGLLNLRKSLINIFSVKIPGNVLFEGFTVGVQDADKKTADLDKRIAVLNKRLEETPSFADGINDITNAFKGLGAEISEEVRLASLFNSKRRELNREQKIFTAQLAVETTLNKNLRRIVVNKLNDDRERLKVQEQINESQIKLAEKQLKLGERDVALSIDTVKLSGERLAFIEKIRSGQIDVNDAIKQAEDLTLSSAAGEETLFNIIEKIIKLEQDRQKLADQLAKSEKAISRIKRDIATKEAKALLVLSQNEFKLAQQLELSDQERLDKLIIFEERAIQSFKTQLDANIINQLEFDARIIEFRIKREQEEERINERQTKSEQELLQFRADLRVQFAKEDLERQKNDLAESNAINKDQVDLALQAIQEKADLEIESVILKNSIILENEELASNDIIRIKEQEAEDIRQIRLNSLQEQEQLQKESNEKIKKLSQEQIKVLNDLVQEGIVLVNTLFDAQKQRNQDDLTELQILKEHEIVLAGDNVERKIAIEQEFFKQEQEIREKQRKTLRRQAIFNKAVAITQITIDTAQAVIKTLAQGGAFAIPLAIAIGAVGAIQLATAIASPIPRFEKGTMNAPSGFAVTDERGPELHTDKRGRIKDMGSTKGPQLKFLSSGDIIRPVSETSAIMEMLGGKINNSFSMAAMSGALKASNDLRPIIIPTNSGLSKQDHREVMKETLGGIEQNVQIFNEKGYGRYKKRKNSRVKQQQRIING